MLAAHAAATQWDSLVQEMMQSVGLRVRGRGADGAVAAATTRVPNHSHAFGHLFVKDVTRCPVSLGLVSAPSSGDEKARPLEERE